MNHFTKDGEKSPKKFQHSTICQIPGCRDFAVYWDAANFALCFKHQGINHD